MSRAELVVARNPIRSDAIDLVLDRGRENRSPHERYPWRFCHQQAATERRLIVGDYGVELDGAVVASVERKSLVDLVVTLTSGRLRYPLADLAALERAAVVVEDRYSSVFRLAGQARRGRRRAG